MSEDRLNYSIGLVGAGNMGGALLAGWLKSGIDPERITVVDPSPPPKIAEQLHQNGVRRVESADACQPVDVLILAVKPQIMDGVLPTLSPMIGPSTLLVSVAAGITIRSMAKSVGDRPSVRVMPNTPALVGQGMSVGYANSRVSADQRATIDELFQVVGKVAWVFDEQQIDAVTAVSGSGPAYVFHLAECIAQAAAAEGLDDHLSMVLTKQTILGAAVLMDGSAEGPAELRENVTSPNGTTAAALNVLMSDQRMQILLQEAIHAARIRSEELSG